MRTSVCMRAHIWVFDVSGELKGVGGSNRQRERVREGPYKIIRFHLRLMPSLLFF